METTNQYLHISSRHRLDTGNDDAVVKVHLPKPIKNCVRCCVKQFTIANHLFNVRKGENILRWAEFYKPEVGNPLGDDKYLYKEFAISMPPKYYTAKEICTKVNELVGALSNHRVTSDTNETPLQLTFSQIRPASTSVSDEVEDDYHIKLELASSAPGVKYFAPIQKGTSIWRHLGFAEGQVINSVKRVKVELDDIAENLLGLQTTYVYYRALTFVGSTAEVLSAFPSVIESPPGLYLTSDELTSGETMETRVNQNSLFCEGVSSNILEFIQFDLGRYSYIHKDYVMPHWHGLHKKDLHEVTIQLRSEEGTLLSFAEVGDFNLVLNFECAVVNDVSPQQVKAYSAEGYRLGHLPDAVRFK